LGGHSIFKGTEERLSLPHGSQVQPAEILFRQQWLTGMGLLRAGKQAFCFITKVKWLVSRQTEWLFWQNNS
jgi:hypothetical protein